jgi:histidinol-phosphate aminotransferase
MTTQIRPQRGLAAMKPYAPGKPVEEVQREYGLDDVIKLASNENPLGPSPQALATMERVLPRLNFYPDGQSYYLRHAIATHLAPGIGPEQIAVGNGADGIIMQVCLAYLDEDCDVIVSRSSFPVYDIFTHTMRAKLIKTPLRDDYGLDLEAMAHAITDRTKLVFVCNPNNPTGLIIPAAEVDAFMEKVPDHVLVIFDEAYYEFVDSDEYPDTLQFIRAGRTNVMVMRTFSKVHGLAGIRLGYGIAPPEILAPMHKVKEPFAVNLLAQAAGIAALEDRAFLERAVAANRAGLGFLYGELDRLGLHYLKSHGNFVLVEIGPHATDVHQKMLERGVIVRPCVNYDLPDFIRISVGDEAQNVRLIDALEEVLRNIL